VNPHYLSIAENVTNKVSLEQLKGARILLTGANGLLGSHLAGAIALANQNKNFHAKVSCLSLSKPHPWLKSIFESPGFSYTQMDLSKNYREITGGYDFVIHAATYGQPKKFLDHPLETLSLNSSVTEYLLNLSARSKARFLFMSTSELYGNPAPEACPVKENHPAQISSLDSRANYTGGKLYSEILCKMMKDAGSVDTRVARVSAVYGPGIALNDDRALNVFIRKALQEGRLQLMDNGAQVRRWLHISDATAMLFHILCHGKEFVYNVCGNDRRSIRDLALQIGEKTGVEVFFKESPQNVAHLAGALNQIDIDNTRIRTEMGSGELRTLNQIVNDTIAWTRDLIKDSKS
jgi:dTDP-glucose 4,6-dehydratase/UDP-glucuronate decarboxylase